MKSDCAKYQANIPRSLLGDLTEEELQALKTHLETCAHCRSERENYLQTLDLMKSVRDEAIPRHFFVNPEDLIRFTFPGG